MFVKEFRFSERPGNGFPFANWHTVCIIVLTLGLAIEKSDRSCF